MTRFATQTVVVVILLLMEIGTIAYPAAAYTFNGSFPVEVSSGTSFRPVALQTSSGKLWLAWESSGPGQSEIYYKIYNFSSWSTTQNLTITQSTVANLDPSLVQLQNSSIVLIWSSNQTGYYNLYYKTFTAGIWKTSIQLTSGGFDDTSTSAAIASDGTLWITWSRQTPSVSCMNGFCWQVYYKTLVGNFPSHDAQSTFDSAWNIEPALMVSKNRNIWATYSKCPSSPCTYDLFSQTYNGTIWSAPLQLTSPSTSTFGDLDPNMAVDRNGTVWLFWSRDVNLSVTVNEGKLFYEFSADGAATWSQPTQLTFSGNVTVPVDDVHPFAVQASDKKLWLFYSSDPSNSGFDLYYFQTNTIYPIHDVAVTNIQVLPYTIIRTIMKYALVKVTVSDFGDYLENVNLTVQASGASSFVIAKQLGLFGSGSTFTFVFNVTQTSFLNGKYTITASVLPVPGETVGETLDDSLQYRSLYVVNATSLVLVCSMPHHPCPA